MSKGNSASAGGGGAMTGNIARIRNAKTLEELAGVMGPLGLDIRHAGNERDGSLKNFDLETLKQASEDFLAIKEQLPGAFPEFVTLKFGGRSTRAYAATSFWGEIGLRSKMKGRGFMNNYENDTRTGYHPKGTTGDDIIAHEFGHVIERTLIYKNPKNTTMFDRMNAWNSNTESKRIVNNASARLAKAGKSKGVAGDRATISGYAKKTMGETLAEAVADVIGNKNNATPMSKAIWAELKKELGGK